MTTKDKQELNDLLVELSRRFTAQLRDFPYQYRTEETNTKIFNVLGLMKEIRSDLNEELDHINPNMLLAEES